MSEKKLNRDQAWDVLRIAKEASDAYDSVQYREMQTAVQNVGWFILRDAGYSHNEIRALYQELVNES